MHDKPWLPKKGWLLGLVVLLVGLVAAGCGGSSSSSDTSSGGQPQHVTLKFMSLANSPSVEAAWKQLVAAFEQQNPDITINRTAVAYGSGGSSYRVKAKLAASSSAAPDLIEGDMGPGGVMASLVADNLLHPLDTYSQQYGWPQIYGDFIAQLQLSSDGKRVGTGPVYGIPDFAEILGVFYNKALLTQLKMQPPQTIDQFEAILKAAKAQGMTPITIGGLDQFPWSHFYDILSDRYGDPKQLIDWFRGNPDSNVDTPQMAQAAERLQSWYKAGYFEDGANGVSDADSGTNFAAGKALFHVSGPWYTEQAIQGLGDNAGFFLMPPLTAGEAPTSTGWMGWSVGVTAKSKYPDQAAKFLNFLTGATARKIMLQHDNPPGTPGTEYAADTPPLVKTIGEDFTDQINAGTLVPYMDVAYPQVDPYNILANSQSMAAGKMSAQDYVKTAQEGWAKYHGY